jgi:hypothetical protein
MKVSNGAKVTPMTDDTLLRVWHYQKEDKYICTLKGQAIVE